MTPALGNSAAPLGGEEAGEYLRRLVSYYAQ
jgi:hypothetical protein